MKSVHLLDNIITIYELTAYLVTCYKYKALDVSQTSVSYTADARYSSRGQVQDNDKPTAG